MQNFKDLYTELTTKAETAIPEVRWQDIWHNQVNFLETEHPFPAPALFYQFRISNTQDMGNKAQKGLLQVDVYVFYETFADTYHKSLNQGSALAFLEILTKVYALLHASEGENYSNMRHIGTNPVDTGGSGNTYLLSFQCELVNYAACIDYEEYEIKDAEVTVGAKPEEEEEEDPLFVV